MAEIKTEGKIYFIQRPGEETATHLAMKVDLDYRKFKGLCYLEPPCRPHMIRGRFGKKTANGFTFKTEDGEWEFVEMNYENFSREFYKFVIGGEKLKAQFKTTEELQNYYNNNFPDYV